MKCKKILAWLLSVAVTLPFINSGFDKRVTAEAGVTDNVSNVTLSDSDDDGYYEIGTVEQLYAFANIVNSGKNTSLNAELTADIIVNSDVLNDKGELIGDGSNLTLWTPIGNLSDEYYGEFDGNGNTISGLYFNDIEQKYVGLFGYIHSNAKIKNVGIVNSYFNGYEYVSGICGYNKRGTITNCYNTGNVIGINIYIGGVCAYNRGGTITNCYNTGNIEGDNSVGGICGINSKDTITATITNCCNTGNINGNEIVGGICGYNSQGTITNSNNIGNVIGMGRFSYVGGICGFNVANNIESIILDCYNKGNVVGAGDCVGGVCGHNAKNALISKCYNTANVDGADSFIGGICGYNNQSTITNSYNTGNVVGAGYCVGGVCGHNAENALISNCYNIANVEGISSYVGGVSSWNNKGTITNCFYLEDTVIGGINGADAEGSAEAKTIEQFTRGEVAYLLQGEQTEVIWGQNVDKEKTYDTYPVLYGDKLYKGYNRCESNDIVYSNNEISTEKFNHNFTYTVNNSTITINCCNNGCDKKSIISVADIVLIQKALVKANMNVDFSVVDINNDGKFNVFDLIIMKRLIFMN